MKPVRFGELSRRALLAATLASTTLAGAALLGAALAQGKSLTTALTADAVILEPHATYELTGNIGDLASHVGRQVEVTGRLDDDRKDEVKVDDEQKTELPEVQSGDDTVKPAIETEMELNINVRRLAVTSVSQTGQACSASR